MKPVTIYTISDADTGYVHYVGATIQPLKSRFSAHKNSVTVKMMELFKSDTPLEILPVETCQFNQADKMEKYWIMQFRSWGFNLINSEFNRTYSMTNNVRGYEIERDNEEIEQYTIGGRLIRVWENIRQAERFGYNACRIYFVLNGKQKLHAKCRWKFKR